MLPIAVGQARERGDVDPPGRRQLAVGVLVQLVFGQRHGAPGKNAQDHSMRCKSNHGWPLVPSPWLEGSERAQPKAPRLNTVALAH